MRMRSLLDEADPESHRWQRRRRGGPSEGRIGGRGGGRGGGGGGGTGGGGDGAGGNGYGHGRGGDGGRGGGGGGGGGGGSGHRDAQTQELFAMSGAELREGGARYQRLIEERDANEMLSMMASGGINGGDIGDDSDGDDLFGLGIGGVRETMIKY